MIRAAVWTVLGVCVVLAARAVVYALAPWQTLAALRLEHQAGGPHLAAVLAVALAVAAVLAAAVLWLAVVAVRGVVFFGATSVAFALFESYLHWRAGLGWHGLRCLVGPVHRDAIPVLGALSLLAVAGHGAVEHLLGWARRLVALLAARLPLLRGAGRVFSSTTGPRFVRVGSSASPRGPPARAFA